MRVFQEKTTDWAMQLVDGILQSLSHIQQDEP